MTPPASHPNAQADDRDAVVRAFIEARGRGDYEAAAGHTAADVVWRVADAIHVGREALRDGLVANDAAGGMIAPDILSVDAEGDHLVATVNARGAAHGDLLDARQVFRFRVADGAIREVELVADDAGVSEPFWEA